MLESGSGVKFRQVLNFASSRDFRHIDSQKVYLSWAPTYASVVSLESLNEVLQGLKVCMIISCIVVTPQRFTSYSKKFENKKVKMEKNLSW